MLCCVEFYERFYENKGEGKEAERQQGVLWGTRGFMGNKEYHENKGEGQAIKKEGVVCCLALLSCTCCHSMDRP